jgi:hypothetical protein
MSTSTLLLGLAAGVALLASGLVDPRQHEHDLPTHADTVYPVSVLFPCYEDQYLMLVNDMAVCVNMDDVHSLAIEDWRQRNP